MCGPGRSALQMALVAGWRSEEPPGPDNALPARTQRLCATTLLVLASRIERPSVSCPVRSVTSGSPRRRCASSLCGGAGLAVRDGPWALWLLEGACVSCQLGPSETRRGACRRRKAGGPTETRACAFLSACVPSTSTSKTVTRQHSAARDPAPLSRGSAKAGEATRQGVSGPARAGAARGKASRSQQRQPALPTPLAWDCKWTSA